MFLRCRFEVGSLAIAIDGVCLLTSLSSDSVRYDKLFREGSLLFPCWFQQGFSKNQQGLFKGILPFVDVFVSFFKGTGSFGLFYPVNNNRKVYHCNNAKVYHTTKRFFCRVCKNIIFSNFVSFFEGKMHLSIIFLLYLQSHFPFSEWRWQT